MASQIASFDYYELQRAKQLARAEDDARLASDPMARAELERRNGMFQHLIRHKCGSGGGEYPSANLDVRRTSPRAYGSYPIGSYLTADEPVAMVLPPSSPVPPYPSLFTSQDIDYFGEIGVAQICDAATCARGSPAKIEPD
ncbi:hypothetical protein [Bosea sp. TAF32]|uniref:hypothetical protein n=1 Tax=Bosea sp. TAF32 TaxID=3237482 RepID=UPI003F91CFF7